LKAKRSHRNEGFSGSGCFFIYAKSTEKVQTRMPASRKSFLKRILVLLPSMGELRQERSAYLLALASGLIMRLPFPRFNCWWLAWIGLVPLLYALQQRKAKSGFYIGLLFGFAFYYTNVFWLNSLTRFNPFVPIGIVIAGLYLALYGALFGWAATHLLRHLPRCGFLVIPAAWVVLEYVRTLGVFAFPWAFLSASQHNNLVAIQIADITGTYGTSFLIVLVNAVIAEALYRVLHHTGRISLVKPAIAAALLAIVIVYGNVAIGKSYASGKALRVGVIQPSVPQNTKLASYMSPIEEERIRLSSELFSQLVSMLEANQAKGVELFVLPETAITEIAFAKDTELHRYLESLARRLNASLFFGADNTVPLDAKGHPVEDYQQAVDVMAYNSAWLIDRKTGLSPNVYNKIQLVPFGEHVPYFDAIPYFQEMIVQVGSFEEGRESTIFECEGVRFGAMICFESSFAYLARRLVRHGAQFLAVITNDAWFNRSAGPYQHDSLAPFRAIESRRYLVRCANTGISRIITPTGQTVVRLPLYARDSFVSTIRAQDGLTFYVRYGDIFVVLCVILVASAAGWIVRGSSRPASR
jgi:apolipoprotein N-acyltransferase